MLRLHPSRKLIQILAGEGGFHLYRLLRDRRLFLFIKLIYTSISYFKGAGSKTSATTVAYVKGPNQLRYFQYAREQLAAEFCSLKLYSSSLSHEEFGTILLPRFNIQSFIQQGCYLILMLITGRRRYLNLYLMSFSEAIRRSINSGFPNVTTFICFNDQPYDVAAIVHVLNQQKNCRTIVIQHGLILSSNFYFPAVAREFWAWGELSLKHYRAWDKTSKIIVKGRYLNDVRNKTQNFFLPPSGHSVGILIAPSDLHDEVKSILKEIDKLLSFEIKGATRISIKFHPATKMKFKLLWWIRSNTPWLRIEEEAMEELVSKYDLLITKNSTSSIDFFLRGKFVLFLEPNLSDNFPSIIYSFELSELCEIINKMNHFPSEKNIERVKFLKSSLNV